MAGSITQLLLRSTKSYKLSSNSLNWLHHIKNYSSSSYAHSVSGIPLSNLTLSQLLDRAVEKYSGNEAVVDCHQNIRKNYAQYKDDVDKFASGLLTLNLKKGDRIGIWSPNNYQWLLTQLAAARLGLILVSINAFNQVREMEYCIRKSGCRVLVAADSLRHIQYYPILQELLPELADSKELIKAERFPTLERIIMISDKKFAGTLNFDDIASAGGPKERSDLEQTKNTVQIHDPASIYFTSGTTGLPSGVLLSHHSVVNVAFEAGKRCKLDDPKIQQRCCSLSPLFHVLGGVPQGSGPLWFGHSLIMPSPMYSAQKTLEALHNETCTFIIGTPTMFIDILTHPDSAKYDLSALNGGMVGGQPVPVELQKLWRQKIKTNNLLAGYGLTETTAGITLMSPKDDPTIMETTTGRPLCHTEVKVVDEQGQVVASNTAGEILVRGYTSMLKYWEDEEKTKKAFTRDNYLKTGDIGKMDENGYLTLVGRISDIIIRGGSNIYPTEVEDYISTHPKILAVQAFGIPDKRLGETLCVWVLLTPGEKMTKEELKEFCNNKIASYKIPEHVKFVQDFPKLGTGKVAKNVMKQQMIEELSK